MESKCLRARRLFGGIRSEKAIGARTGAFEQGLEGRVVGSGRIRSVQAFSERIFRTVHALSETSDRAE